MYGISKYGLIVTGAGKEPYAIKQKHRRFRKDYANRLFDIIT